MAKCVPVTREGDELTLFKALAYMLLAPLLFGSGAVLLISVVFVSALSISELATAAIFIGTPVFYFVTIRSSRWRSILIWAPLAIVALVLQLNFIAEGLYHAAVFPQAEGFWDEPRHVHSLFVLGLIYGFFALSSLFFVLLKLLTALREFRKGSRRLLACSVQ